MFKANMIAPCGLDCNEMNLRMIRRDGMDAFLEYERQRWTCPNCGRPFSVHDRNCPHCGKSVLGTDA